MWSCSNRADCALFLPLGKCSAALIFKHDGLGPKVICREGSKAQLRIHFTLHALVCIWLSKKKNGRGLMHSLESQSR